MNRVQIVFILNKVFVEFFNEKAGEFEEENFDKTLTGFFGFSGREMVYLYILVEKNFNISIDNKKLSNNGFNTINGIVNIVSIH